LQRIKLVSFELTCRDEIQTETLARDGNRLKLRLRQTYNHVSQRQGKEFAVCAPPFLPTPPKKNSAYPTTPSAFAVKKFMQTDQKRPGPLANAARN